MGACGQSARSAMAALCLSISLSSCAKKNPPCVIGDYYFSRCPCETEELAKQKSACVANYLGSKPKR